MSNKVLKLDPKDNVLIALAICQKGDQISFAGQSHVARGRPRKHKFATRICRLVEVKNVRGDRGKTVEPIVRGGLLTTRIFIIRQALSARTDRPLDTA